MPWRLRCQTASTGLFPDVRYSVARENHSARPGRCEILDFAHTGVPAAPPTILVASRQSVLRPNSGSAGITIVQFTRVG